MRIGFIIAGVVFIIIFFLTLLIAEFPLIWIGALIVGASLIYRGATTNPPQKANRVTSTSNIQPEYHRQQPTVTRPEEAALYCPSCGREINPEWTACPYCKSRLQNVCPVCGKRIESDWAACPHCGHDLKTTCPSCGRELQPDWTACPYCKTSIQ